MKNKILRLSLIAAASTLLVVSTGSCASVRDFVTKPGAVEVIAPAQTNLVPVITTNAVTGEVTITSIPVIRPAILYTNMELAVAIPASVRTVEGLATAGGIPFARTIAEALLLAFGGAVTWFNLRNKRRLRAELDSHADTQSALAIAEDVGTTLVKNFEQLRKTALTIPGYTRDVDDKVMTGIQTAQIMAGEAVKSVINDLVDEHTEFTIPGGSTAVN